MESEQKHNGGLGQAKLSPLELQAGIKSYYLNQRQHGLKAPEPNSVVERLERRFLGSPLEEGTPAQLLESAAQGKAERLAGWPPDWGNSHSVAATLISQVENWLIQALRYDLLRTWPRTQEKWLDYLDELLTGVRSRVVARGPLVNWAAVDVLVLRRAWSSSTREQTEINTRLWAELREHLDWKADRLAGYPQEWCSYWRRQSRDDRFLDLSRRIAEKISSSKALLSPAYINALLNQAKREMCRINPLPIDTGSSGQEGEVSLADVLPGGVNPEVRVMDEIVAAAITPQAAARLRQLFEPKPEGQPTCEQIQKIVTLLHTVFLRNRGSAAGLVYLSKHDLALLLGAQHQSAVSRLLRALETDLALPRLARPLDYEGATDIVSRAVFANTQVAQLCKAPHPDVALSLLQDLLALLQRERCDLLRALARSVSPILRLPGDGYQMELLLDLVGDPRDPGANIVQAVIGEIRYEW